MAVDENARTGYLSLCARKRAIRLGSSSLLLHNPKAAL
jgi:hypothetical protein